MRNKENLNRAKKRKADEFYTRLEDVEAELEHYTQHFKGKTVLLPADNPDESAFWEYFATNFERLGLHTLIATYYIKEGQGGGAILTPEKLTRFTLVGDGDFSSQEVIDLLKTADIVVTNPPYSRFQKFLNQLIKYKKKFIIVGSVLVPSVNNSFNIIKNKEMWFGVSRELSKFYIPESYYNEGKGEIDPKTGRIQVHVSSEWFTNIEHGHTTPPIPLVKKYKGNEDDFPKYENEDAINVDRVKDIPSDYDGVIGVPITFLRKWNEEQFEVVGGRYGTDGKYLRLPDRNLFARILIKKIKNKEK